MTTTTASSPARAVWAERHPRPDTPALIRAGGEVLTPRQLACEVAQRTERGRKHLAIFRHFAAVEPDIGEEGFIAMFEATDEERGAGTVELRGC